MTRLLLAGVVVLMATLTGGGAIAETAPALSAYGADASGTGVRVLGATNAFPNFRTGFLDNSYPLATSHIDASPASQATASVADTGPLGSTAASQANGAQQPQYAVASFPGTAKATKSAGVSVADAAALETAASSRGAVIAVGSAGPGSVEDPKDPLHTGADAAESHVSIDRATSKVSAESSGHVARATFGGGALVISALNTHASVTIERGRATPHSAVEIGDVTVNGTPVKLSDKGVVVDKDPLPGSDALTQVVNDQLTSALRNAGLEVFLTPPRITVSGASATVATAGVHVRYTAPAVDPSVPSLSLEYILGEARAFAFATGAAASASATPSAGAGLGAASGTTEASGTEPAATVAGPSGESSLGVTSPLASLPSSATTNETSTLQAAPAFVRASARPTWLLVMYLVWQALVIAAAGVVLWWRAEASRG